MRYLFTSILLSFLFLAGCATSHSTRNNDLEENKSTFNTGLTYADLEFRNSRSLLKPIRMKFQVSAECTGAGCIPDEIELAFFGVPGDTKVVLTDLTILINTGKVIYQWKEPKGDHRKGGILAEGYIRSVTLNKEMLQEIAEYKDISGSIGGQGFEWSYENRKPIRELLADMRLSESNQ